MCLKHQWGKWEEDIFNQHVFQHVKTESRYCKKCNQRDTRELPALEIRFFRLFEEAGINEEAIERGIAKLRKDYGEKKYQKMVKTLLKAKVEKIISI